MDQSLPRRQIREEVVLVVPVARPRSSCTELAEERPEAGFNYVSRDVVHCPGPAHITIGGPAGEREVSELTPITRVRFYVKSD